MSEGQSNQSGRDTIHAGRDVYQIGGDNVAGDKVVHLYQAIWRPLPVQYRTLVQPLIEHYTAVFGGRETELATLDAFLADPDHPCALLVAPTGRGKTALLVHWIARVQQQSPQWRVIFAPISIRFQTASEQVALGLLAHSLAEAHNDLDQYGRYDQSPLSLRALISDYLRRPLPAGVQLLVAIDGIDKATGWQLGPLGRPADRVKIIVAAREHAKATRADYQHQLGWDYTPVQQLTLANLTRPAVEELLRQSGLEQAGDPDFIDQFYRVSEGDPLTCNLLIKALTSGAITPDSLSRRPPSQPSRARWQKRYARSGMISEGQSNQSGPIHAGRDVNQIGGDYVAGDKVVHQYQAIWRPLPVQYRTLVQPLIEHYTAVFGGRETELAALDAFLADPDHPCALLVAPTGRGKTALLVHWIARVQQQSPQWRIIFAPISIRFQTASEQVALGLLAHSLAEAHNDLDQYSRYDQSPPSLRALISDYLRRPLPAGVQLLVAIDGIDEATGWQLGPLGRPAAGVKIIVAAREHANATRAGYQHQLGWDYTPVQQLTLANLTRPAVAALLRQSGLEQAGDPDFIDQFYRVSEGDPLTCNLLIKALRSNAITPASLSRRPPGLAEFLRDWVDSLRKRRQASRPIRELLALCAAAYGPLSSDDLQALAPDVFAEQSEIVDAVHDDEVARFIITVGEHTYVFSHQRLREVFLEQVYPAKDRAQLQQRLISYGKQWYANRSQPLPDYLRQFWIAHLRAGGEWELMERVLTEIVPSADGQRVYQPWQVARSAAEGSDTGYLSDLAILWDWADQHNDLGLALRCALIAASLRSRSGNLTPELLVQLVQIGTPEGTWSAAAALETVAHMPEARQQAACIGALIEAGIELLWERALEVARTITDEWYQAQTLAALAPHLPSPLLAEAFAAAQAITDEWPRAEALAALVPRLPPAERDEVLTNALAAVQAISNEYSHARALAVLAPHLPPVEQDTVLTNALAATQAIANEWPRVEALAALAPRLPEPLLAAALATAQTIANEWPRAKALTALAPHLPKPLLSKALAAALAIADRRYRVRVLAALAPHLSSADRDEVLAAVAIADRRYHVRALVTLAPHLSSAERNNVLAEALTTATAIRVEDERAEALAALGPHLPEPLLADALTAAKAITNEGPRAAALAALAPHLPEPLLADALAAAQVIRAADARARALAALAPYLPPPDREAALAEALTAAQTITDERYRAEALAALAPHLPPPDQTAALAEVLAAAQAITDERYRAEALAALAPHLPPAERDAVLTKALAATQAIRAADARAEALATLAPHLPPPLLVDAFDVAKAITDAGYRAKALTAIAPLLPPPNREAALAETLTAAQAISNEWSRTDVLAALAPHLPEPLLAEALAAATAINERYRARALAALAPHLPEPLLIEALAAAQAITDEWYRAEALAALAPYLPSPDREATQVKALAAAQAINDEKNRATVLAALAPHLSPPLLAEALAAAQAITNEEARAYALATLASHLPPVERDAGLAAALTTALAITDVKSRTFALAVLAPHLPEPVLAEALADALAAAYVITDAESRFYALVTLTPHLPTIKREAVLTDAFTATQDITEEVPRSFALTTLIPYLPKVLLAAALASACAINLEGIRTAVLAALAPQLASAHGDNAALFAKTLRDLARRGRPALLGDLAALAPWIVALAEQLQQPKLPAALAQHIVETARCWP
ncbi:hypothetical protein A6A03_15645 [Chloroflexus islandicus]|uniref:NACHT domain-containing protein n=1 Tax=Chloroflexus islandicus TaxID=1707952 RepID=A0A178MAU0_9CHLR|nr:ATP-binding protein [Chloroflexus islandicus]OAN45148.1 hypothetical protein A6A03_15645 [Chloroflexus islandicus]